MLYDIETSVGFHLTKAARMNERLLDAILSEFRLNRTMWATLVAIGVNSLSQPSRIADFIGVDRPGVSRSITGLRKLGLVEKSFDRADGRMAEVNITKDGRDTLKELSPRILDHNKKFFGVVADDEAKILRRMLQRLHERGEHLSRL